MIEIKEEKNLRKCFFKKDKDKDIFKVECCFDSFRVGWVESREWKFLLIVNVIIYMYIYIFTF